MSQLVKYCQLITKTKLFKKGNYLLFQTTNLFFKKMGQIIAVLALLLVIKEAKVQWQMRISKLE